MVSSEIASLIELRDKLLALDKDKTDNRLDYMQWQRYPKQADARNAIIERINTRSGPTIHVVFGGNRSGKSELGGGVIGWCCKNLTGARIWCATQSDLSVKVQQRKCRDLIRAKDIDYGEYNDVRGWKNRTIITKKQTAVFFKTYEQGASAFQGDDIDLFWGDEEMPYDVFNESMVRLGDRQGVMLLTFTSLLGFTRLVNRLWESSDRNVKTTVLVLDENPFLSEAAKKQIIDNMDPDEVASRRYGKPYIKQGLIYKEFGDDHKIERFDYQELVVANPRRYKLHEGIDPHDRTPHHWLRFLYDQQEDILYVVEEVKASRESMLISDFARLIKMQRGKYRNKQILQPEFCQIDTSSMIPTVAYRPDKNEEQPESVTIKTEFAKAGIPTILVVKDNQVGFDSVKERLKTLKLADGTIKRKPKLYVFNDLKGVIYEFARYSWDSYHSDRVSERKEIINRPQKKDDHYMDIIKYEAIKVRPMVPDSQLEAPSYQERYEGMGW